MKVNKFLICSVVIAAIVFGGIAYWEMRFRRSVREMPLGDTKEILLSALADQVLSPGITGDPSKSRGALLDQYRENPALIHERYLLVMTWTHATNLFKATAGNWPGEPVSESSAALTSVPAEDRVDGWGNPYCLLADSNQMTILSSGGQGLLNCEQLRNAATQAASKTHDSRLFKDGNLLVAVYPRGARPRGSEQ